MAPAADGPGSDSELLRRIARRDREAFASLYRRYAQPVYGLALRSAGARRDAEAATERAFAAIWNAAATGGPGEGSVRRWLFAVARSAIVEHAGARGEAQLVACGRPEAASAEQRPEPQDGDDWLTFCVHGAVAELPEQERVPLELTYWGGRSQTEVAELLGLPLTTIELRTRSALTRLAVRLADADGA